MIPLLPGLLGADGVASLGCAVMFEVAVCDLGQQWPGYKPVLRLFQEQTLKRQRIHYMYIVYLSLAAIYLLTTQ